MTDLRGWGLHEQHLLPDVVVAFVDGELSATPHDRAAAHLARCRSCAAEAATQRYARAATRTATTPSAPASLLASLRAIPRDVELPTGPDNLAVSEDGQLVTVLRPGRARQGDSFGGRSPFGSSTPLGGTAPLGSARTVVGGHIRFPGRRSRQGAGVVVSGLVLGALAVVAMHGDTPATDTVAGGPGTARQAVATPSPSAVPVRHRPVNHAPAVPEPAVARLSNR
ncbi:MAG: zf-HC2 domain-containing protein [Kutzneria sp.]|nr:zf-HC2 domain-containing protein [Kutzneria sp.]MBV9847122.1 zf-HC2 domain-containing protein [Kutzneria sp.]